MRVVVVWASFRAFERGLSESLKHWTPTLQAPDDYAAAAFALSPVGFRAIQDVRFIKVTMAEMVL